MVHALKPFEMLNSAAPTQETVAGQGEGQILFGTGDSWVSNQAPFLPCVKLVPFLVPVLEVL